MKKDESLHGKYNVILLKQYLTDKENHGVSDEKLTV